MFLIRIIANLCAYLPGTLLSGVAYLLGTFFYFFIPVRKKTIHLQIKKTLGREWSDKKIRNIVRLNYIHYASLLFELLILFSKSSKKKEYTRCHFYSRDDLVMKEALSEGKGVILIGAHVGSWEAIGGYCENVFNIPVTVTVKLVASPLFQRMREEIQAIPGINLIDGRMGRKRIVALLQALRNKEFVGIFLDQFRPTEPFVKFFSHEARTNSTAAILHRKTGAPVIMIHMIRERIGRYRVDIRRATPPEVSALSEDQAQILALNGYFNNRLEEIIREYPDQWLWAHRRFKENPEFKY